MGEIVKNLSEHSSSIIIILGLFSIWSAKRILGKLESSVADLVKEVRDGVSEQKKINRDLYERGNKTDQELHELIGEHKATHKKGGP